MAFGGGPPVNVYRLQESQPYRNQLRHIGLPTTAAMSMPAKKCRPCHPLGTLGRDGRGDDGTCRTAFLYRGSADSGELKTVPTWRTTEVFTPGR